MKVRRRFWVLRLIAELLKLTALATLVLGALGLVTAFGGEFATMVATGARPLGLPQLPDILFTVLGLASMAVGFVTFLVLYGISQLFYVFIAIEENTRALRQTRRVPLEEAPALPRTAELAG
ncbi:MAG: hypothetical protein EPO21_15795 [Chloroflexota bacterium]|nr:MAG: hypothetical protein EPO21_15795 [Chloroflexota bacterium]